jgi:hypothetical protein
VTGSRFAGQHYQFNIDYFEMSCVEKIKFVFTKVVLFLDLKGNLHGNSRQGKPYPVQPLRTIQQFQFPRSFCSCRRMELDSGHVQPLCRGGPCGGSFVNIPVEPVPA